ncbi:uncharacterized protein ACR2FA_004650 [Aphomia sociella]
MTFLLGTYLSMWIGGACLKKRILIEEEPKKSKKKTDKKSTDDAEEDAENYYFACAALNLMPIADQMRTMGHPMLNIGLPHWSPVRPVQSSLHLASPCDPPSCCFVNEEVIKTVNKAVISENYRKISLVKSDTVTDKTHQKHLKETKSCSSIKHFNALNYIFGDESSYGNKVYCVNYFTVEKGHTSSGGSLKGQSSNNIEEPERQTKVKLCNCGCSSKKETTCSCTQSYCSLDLPKELAHLINIRKCQQIKCDAKKHQKTSPLPDDRILLDIHSMQKECCDVTEAVEEVVGGMEAKMKFGEDPCLCSCECRFGFTKKTTYCKVCGGYERTGEEIVDKHGQEPFPCPIYHKLIDKNKLKTWSTSGSDSKKRTEDSQKNLKSASKSPTEKRPIVSEKNAESEKESKKSKKKVKDDRFKFNYGYQGIPPHIGHSHCAMPCTGTLGVVPKNMGWLWTAEDILGLKFRPMWKPGATNKHVVRLLRMAKNPDVVISKKRRKDARLKKRPLKRPLLIIHKKDGEYTVTMETMKTFTKARTFNQYPYEDKPVLTYTIGRTDEENRERQKKKEREQRRLERAQRQFIQSAFRDMCQEICLKTYQQALGILPDAENPECPCYPAHPDADKINLDLSCSCSEEKSYIGSDTDSDEWIVEFTPPNATFDPSFKSKKIIKVDNATQYTYLDYRVKLVDRFGNPVPRYFKGPDGKQQCSDLGGFWSPDHNWLEINIDGYIAPDERWAPNNFIGPSSEQVDAETGKFQATNGKWLVVGVDGYVDGQGKWRFYPKQRAPVPQKKRHLPAVRGKKIDKQHDNTKESEGTWSCFGDASPKYLSKMGIIGHGPDKSLLLSKLKDMLAHGEDVRMPEPSLVPHLPVSKKGKKQHILPPRMKCRHPVPSDKGILAVDSDGNKIYFKLKHRNNLRPNERIANLTNRGISLSSFHVPCFHSFINTEIMKQQQRERLLAADKRMIVAQGWRPGAISTRLLGKLNKAKLQKSAVELEKPSKKSKKRIDNKPALIISKIDGEYKIEMQVTPPLESTQDYCSPLVYKITKANNEDRIKKLEKKKQRLIRNAVGDVWCDLYHPDVCERTCQKAYKRTIGLLPFDANNSDRICESDEEGMENINSCLCDDENDSSNCSSTDINWEIHFSPPYHHSR